MNTFFETWGLFIFATAGAASLVTYWIVETLRHDARLNNIPIRVHVNGIRGKSTIVRYIAAALRSGGIETIAKTTGSATRVILEDGREEPVIRTGAPTILEQIDILDDYTRSSTGALVIECMALQPEYQKVSERRMIKATDGIIANVRRDHIDILGSTLPDIAVSLANTAPNSAPLYTSETSGKVLEVLEKAAKAREGELIAVEASTVTDKEMDTFDPLAFRENISLALAVAERHGVDRKIALVAMAQADLDPGASRVHSHAVNGGEILWVDLFGVNDVSSAQMNIDRITKWIDSETDIGLVLNLRGDRQDRSVEFAQMIAQGDPDQRIYLAGETVSAARQAITRGSDVNRDIVDLDLSDVHKIEDLGEALGLLKGKSIALIGLANIHTSDADKLRELLETPGTEWTKKRDEKEGQDDEPSILPS